MFGLRLWDRHNDNAQHPTKKSEPMVEEVSKNGKKSKFMRERTAAELFSHSSSSFTLSTTLQQWDLYNQHFLTLHKNFRLKTFAIV